MKTYITLDAGSCHMGKKELAQRLIDEAADAGADAIKFQLGVKNPNIDLPIEWWPDLVLHATICPIDIYASCFTVNAVNRYTDLHDGAKIYKFAYSQRNDKWLMEKVKKKGFRTIISCDHMTVNNYGDLADIKLLCFANYPLYWTPRFVDCFPPHDGLSDHSLGIDVPVAAVKAGARYIEKHIRLPESKCPDANFALMPGEAAEMVRKIRNEKET